MNTPLVDEIFGGFEKQAGKAGLLRQVGRRAFKVRTKNPTPRYLSHVRAGGKSSTKEMRKIQEGYRRAASEGMPESFVAELPVIGLDKAYQKATGRKGVVRRKMFDYISEPAMAVDTAVGSKLEKIPLVGGAFRTRERIPWGPRKQNLEKTVERPSAVGPLTKIKDFAAPLIIAGGLERGTRALLEKRRKQNAEKTAEDGAMMSEVEIQKIAQADDMDRQLREKVASTMLRLHRQNKEHEKQAQAMRLIYKQAELGLEALPQSYDELQQKVASMVGQDMTVLEKALELTAGSSGLGELASGETISSPNAETTFQSEVLA